MVEQKSSGSTNSAGHVMGVGPLSTGHDNVRMQCRDCDGDGVVGVPRMAMRLARRNLTTTRYWLVGTSLQARPCRTCQGYGWTPGFWPPV